MEGPCGSQRCGRDSGPIFRTGKWEQPTYRGWRVSVGVVFEPGPNLHGFRPILLREIMMRQKARGFFVLGIVTMAMAWPVANEALAQSRTTSVVRGTVVGPQGAPVEGANVTMRQLQTGAEQGTASNSLGRFLFPLLQPGGPYELAVSLLGYAREQRDSLWLAVGEIITLDIELRQEAIEVEGIEIVVDRAEIFNPSQVGPATRITERTVELMPLMSRNIMELAVLSPLVKTTESGGFSVAGQNDRYNAIMVDGILSKDVFGLTSGGVPGGQAGAKLIPVDAVAQYEILIAPFDVRLSGFTGGVMNAVTRTGTNEWRIKASAVHRAEALMGDLTLPNGPVEASGVDRSLLALSVGGPIKRDRGHFFLTGEFEKRHQPPPGFNLLRDDPLLVRISPEAIGAMQELFVSDFGLETGEAGTYPLGQQLSNVFGRLDWNFEGGTRLTIRNVFSHSENDKSPNRFAAYPYELSSNAVFNRSLNNSTSMQLYSELGNWGANEMALTIQHTSDQTTPASDWPQVEVELLSSIANSGFRRPVRVGGQLFAQQNELEQTSYRFTNSLNLISGGESAIVLGVTGSYYDISHTFLPGATGEYYFASPVDLEANAPQRYQRTVMSEGQSPGVDFQVLEWGAFVQNQIDPGKGLTMRFGLRVDVPHVLGSPEENPTIKSVLDMSTSNVPTGNFLISPRWGFNWQSEGRLTTQVRGGAGMFAGQIPYVWLSNAFHNSGLRSYTNTCQGRLTDDPLNEGTGGTVPAFDPYNPPTACAYGDFNVRRNVVLFKEGFKFPQDLKFSAAVDQELSDRLSFSLGLLFNKALNQVGLEDLNIERGGSTHTLGIDSGLGDPYRRYFRPLTRNHAGREVMLPDYDQVLMVTNKGEDWGASISGEFRGALTDDLSFQMGYAWAGSWDRTSLVYTDMISNFGFRPTSGNPNKPNLTTSNFDRPHKFVAAVYGAPIPGLPDTEVSLLYTGQSGLPFSYVYRFDLNGDGYPGLGGAQDRNNDLLYVPFEGTELPGSFVTMGLMGSALESDKCLSENRGEFLPRNGCRAPWENRLDLRFSHTFRLAGASMRLEGDLINVLNLLNSQWGTVETIPPVVPLLEDATGERGLMVAWGSAVLTTRNEEGRLRAADPWNVVSPDSQWQLQFGLHTVVGAGR